MAVNTSPDSISLDEVEGSWKSRHNCYRDRERTLVCRHSPWALAAGWQLRGYQGETELCGSKERAGEIASNVPGLSPLPAQPTNAIFLGLGIPPKWH